MIKSDKFRWYFIEGFRRKDEKSIFDILKCFTITGNKLLFKHYFFKLEDLDNEVRSEIIEQNFSSFCSNVILYNNKENRKKTENIIKEMLYENLKDLYKFNESDENIIKNMLFEKLCLGELQGINCELLSNIKEIVAKSISEEYVPDVDDFINERIVFKNSISVSYEDIELEKPLQYVWYLPKNDDEIIKAIEIEDFLECVVTKNFEDFSEYLYAFEFFEQTDYVLAINDRVGDFEQNIMPKLNTIVRGKYKIISEIEFLKSIDY